jgi:hypothetical protein
MQSRCSPTGSSHYLAGKEGKDAQVMSSSGLKAGFAGSVGLVVVLLISLIRIPFPLGTCLVTLGFVVVWVGTGMLAGLLTEETIQTRRQATSSGAMAGFVAGIGGGVVAMGIAALGILFPDMGEGVLAQFSPAQIEALAQIGFGPETIRLAGSILSALTACGIGGTTVSVILGSLGGRIYFSLRQL